jgi:hypothetical protein
VAFGSPEFYGIWDNVALRQSAISQIEAEESAKRGNLLDFYALLDTWSAYDLARGMGESYPDFKTKTIGSALQEAKQKRKSTPDERIAQDDAQADFMAQLAANRRANRQSQES